MKIFNRCPKCKKPMLNEIVQGIPGCNGKWRLTCLAIDHDILALTKKGRDDILESVHIAIRMDPKKMHRIYADWNFDKKELTITNGWLGPSFYEPNAIVPYFEPNLARYDKLIKKLLTYLIFS